MNIKLLPVAIANQIAAGEVIERPASVVKELLENAYDAKASIINIDIGCGGLNQIKISDNGEGIAEEDLILALTPHATSKISELKDLEAITTMGFRGEALASIASIARLSISSKQALQKNAMCISFANGSWEKAPCARAAGTTIDVSDLFFNAPVRKKFLKSEQTEYQAIENLVKRFALSAQSIAITLNHNGRLQLKLEAGTCDDSRLLRIRKIFGKNFIDNATYFTADYLNMNLSGWLAGQGYQLSQSEKLLFYVNGRMVKDKLLNHAVKQAYLELLYPGRYPACLLYLNINPEEVDVNVHPTKHELRFHQPRLVHDFIRSQLQKILYRMPAADTNLRSGILSRPPHPNHLPQGGDESGLGNPLFQGEEGSGLSNPSSQGEEGRGLSRNSDMMNKVSSSNLSEKDFTAQLRKWNYGLYARLDKPLQLQQAEEASKALAKEYKNEPRVFIENAKVFPSNLTWFNLNDDFALVSISNEPYLIDLDLLYRHWLLSILLKMPLPLAKRPLLVPVHFNTNDFPLANLTMHQPSLEQVGIGFAKVSGDKIIVRSIPIAVSYLNIATFLTALFKETKAFTIEDLLSLLANCQVFEAKNISVEEKINLKAYLEMMHNNIAKLNFCCKHLSKNFCASIF